MGEDSITLLPLKCAPKEALLVYPSGAVCFDHLNELRWGHGRMKAKEQVNMIWYTARRKHVAWVLPCLRDAGYVLVERIPKGIQKLVLATFRGEDKM